MTRALRQSMAWIHGWLGLLAGWILFAMFLTGTSSYFRPEITRWMQPELHDRATTPDRAAAAAIEYLQRVGADDVQWYIFLPDGRTTETRVFEQVAAHPRVRRAPAEELALDPITGVPVQARDTRGGEHFYRFHFQLQLPYPWGRYLAGLCAMAMLGAILSGVVTHKRIFVDFFTLRWNKGQRSWLDAHNVSAVLALPYHMVITYTGLMTLVATYMPWPILANYKQPAQFASAVYGVPLDAAASGRRAPLVPIAPLLRDAERRLGGPVGRVVIRNPNDDAATVTIARQGGGSIDARTPGVTYAGATGALVSAPAPAGVAATTAGVLLGLHLAQFAGPELRWTLFLLGLTGAAMVGTGLLLWTAARRRPNAAPFFGLRLVERLNIGVVAGLPLAMGAYLLANRLIPAQAPGRADAEVATMFWVWGGAALLQLLRPTRRAWTEVFGLGAAVFLAIPVADAVTTGRGLPASLWTGDTLFAAFDSAMLVIAALLGVASWRSARPRRARPVGVTVREVAHV